MNLKTSFTVMKYWRISPIGHKFHCCFPVHNIDDWINYMKEHWNDIVAGFKILLKPNDLAKANPNYKVSQL